MVHNFIYHSFIYYNLITYYVCVNLRHRTQITTYNFFLWTHLNKLYEAIAFTVYIDIFILIKDSILIGLTF